LGRGELLWELNLGGTGGKRTPQCETLFPVRQVWFYSYVGGILRLWNLGGYFRQGAEVVSEVFPVAGIPGPPSEFRFRVPVFFCYVDVNYC
jgi:hypothetical protein